MDKIEIPVQIIRKDKYKFVVNIGGVSKEVYDMQDLIDVIIDGINNMTSIKLEKSDFGIEYRGWFIRHVYNDSIVDYSPDELLNNIIKEIIEDLNRKVNEIDEMYIGNKVEGVILWTK